MTGQVKAPNLSGTQLERLARFRRVAEAHLENLGAAIRRTREAQNGPDGRQLSRRELGERFGATEKTVERYENGTSGGAMTALANIADALGVTTDDLLALAAQIGRERAGAEVSTEPSAPVSVEQLQRELAGLRSEVLGELGKLRKAQEDQSSRQKRDSRSPATKRR